MSTRKALHQLKSVWGKAGLPHIPSPDETRGNIDPKLAGRQVRKKSARTARLDVRCTPEEKQRIGLRAVAEGVSINEIFARMLAVYEREKGLVELGSATGAGDERDH
jgi:hypothetical protein